MSAKVVFDRIYAALECGDYSLAQQLCQKPEIAKYSLAHALLAYSFASQRQYDKALELARVVNNLQSSDESVVNALGCTFKLCKADDDFALCYENAMKSPGCMAAEHNILELFYCYGRLNQPKKMQQVAQKLYKTTDNSKYLLWSTGCMLLQSDLSPTMLAVAEKMLRKVLCDNPDRAPGAEELPLFLLVLVRQGKLKEALEELGSLRMRRGTGRLQDEHDFKRNVNGVQSPALVLDLIKIDLLRALHCREDVMAACYEVLEQYPDQWNLHQVLLDCVFGGPATFLDGVSELLPLRDLSPWTSSAPISVAIAEAQQEAPCDASVSKHLERLEDWQRRHPKLRGPFLAELYALRRWATRGAADAVLSAESASLLPRLASRLENYVERFQSKPCCFADLQPLLSPFAESSRGTADEALWASLLQHTARLRDALANELRATLAERTARPQTGEEAAGPADGPGEGGREGEGGGEEGGDDGCKKAGRKGRKPKKAKKKAGGAAEPAMKPVDAPRLQALATRDSDVVVQLTAYAQLDLVASRCAERLAPPAAEQPLGDFLEQRLPLFAASTALFANGVGGELRCQQPGDDVMLVVSQRLQRSAGAVDWSAALLFALEKSKFNFNLKIDLLEACWRLGHAALALDMWRGLGVKNIQHDSMSYLIVPLLLERGYFAEARSQCQAVIACQRSTRRETADMLAHAFDFANYHKALELGAFLDVSQRSLALAAARQEFLLLEFADRGFRASAVKAMDPAWFESYAPHDVAGLASHCDYALLARAGDSRTAAAAAAARQRDDQLRVRVHWAQAIAQLVHHHVHALWELVAQDVQRLPPLDDVLAAAADAADADGDASETARFSQAALTRDASLVACTHAVWRAAGRALLLARSPQPAPDALDALDAALAALGDVQRQLAACAPARVVACAAACLLYLLGPGSVLLQDALARGVEAHEGAGEGAGGAGGAGVEALRGMARAAAAAPDVEEVRARVEAGRGEAAAACLCAWGLAAAWRAVLHTVRTRLEEARPHGAGGARREDGDVAMRCLRAVQGEADRLRERVEAGLRQSHEESCARLLKCAGDIDGALRAAAGKSQSK